MIIFGIPVKKVNVPINNLLEGIDLDSINYAEHNWDCKVRTTKGLKESLGWEEKFLSSIRSEVEKYIESNFSNFSSPDVGVGKPWLNIYGEGDNQEIHNHLPEHVSYAYMVKIPENSGKFIFLNTGYFTEASVYPFDKLINQRFEVDAEEGDLLIFPSFLNHMVSTNFGDTRITISGNIRL
jgi:uncharacterized protein (TIGR02466 family)